MGILAAATGAGGSGGIFVSANVVKLRFVVFSVAIYLGCKNYRNVSRGI